MKNIPVQLRPIGSDKRLICLICERDYSGYYIQVPIRKGIVELLICHKCWKTKQKTIELILKNIRKMNNELLFIKDSFQNDDFNLNELMTDALNTFRYNNQLSVLEQTKEVLNIRGVKLLKKVPVKWLVTLMDYVSYEDNPIMQMNWAILLTNIINGESGYVSSSYYTFIQLYSKCGIPEATIMDDLFNYSFISGESHYGDINPKSMITILKERFTPFDVLIAVENLFQLKLITYLYPKEIDQLTNELVRENDNICFTLLGAELWKNLKKIR